MAGSASTLVVVDAPALATDFTSRSSTISSPAFNPMLNRLAHTPEERQRALDDAADVPAPGLIHQEVAERHVDHVIKRGLVQPAHGGHLVLKSFGIEPGDDFGLDLAVARPSEKSFVAIGANGLVGGRDGGVHARMPCEVHVPAA